MNNVERQTNLLHLKTELFSTLISNRQVPILKLRVWRACNQSNWRLRKYITLTLAVFILGRNLPIWSYLLVKLFIFPVGFHSNCSYFCIFLPAPFLLLIFLPQYQIHKNTLLSWVKSVDDSYFFRNNKVFDPNIY